MTYYVSSGTLNLTKLKPNQTVSESLQGALSPSLPWFSFADNYISHWWWCSLLFNSLFSSLCCLDLMTYYHFKRHLICFFAICGEQHPVWLIMAMYLQLSVAVGRGMSDCWTDGNCVCLLGAVHFTLRRRAGRRDCSKRGQSDLIDTQ